MKYARMTAKELVHRLSSAGEVPHPDLIDAILARREEMEPLLLDIFAVALDDDWADSEDPRWYRFGHTGRFMIAWQTHAALPTFARLYGAEDREILDLCEWFEEDLAYYGPPAIPFLKQIVRKDSDGEWHYGKGLSGSMLTRIASRHPGVRDDIISFFRAQLPAPENLPQDQDEMWGNWASELAELGDNASREQILALDEAGVLDGAFFERNDYLQRLDRDIVARKLAEVYDLSAEYRRTYKWQQERRRKEVERQRLERRQRVQAATTPKKVKIGRNDPCPCGSGLKYKKCHGRPDAR